MGLCARAHNGLIRTSAVLLVVGAKRHEQVVIPAEFWWAKGHEALEQNWDTGDFSTWIDHRVEWRAFGVAFDFDGVLAMVPAERRACRARELSVAGDPGWASAREAREIACAIGGLDIETAGRVLINHGQLGFIAARAVSMQRTDDHHPHKKIDTREWDVPTWFWSNFTRPRVDIQRWDEGRFEGQGESPTGQCRIVLLAVYMSRDGLEAAFPPPYEPDKATERKNKGGRPLADFWDSLWCAVCGSIYRGDLHPKRQADIERWMLQWASDHGHEVGESTVRPRARKLFEALNEEAENPGSR